MALRDGQTENLSNYLKTVVSVMITDFNNNNNNLIRNRAMNFLKDYTMAAIIAFNKIQF